MNRLLRYVLIKKIYSLLLHIAYMTLSTYRLQNKGVTGVVANALCSVSSITRFVIREETADHIAVSKT